MKFTLTMPEQITEHEVNLNNRVYFQLSELGRKILHDKFIKEIDDLTQLPIPRLKKNAVAMQDVAVNEDGHTEMTLWEFAATFGPHMHMGTEPIIVNNSLSFSKPD